MEDTKNSSGPTKYLCFRLGKTMRKILRYYDANLSEYKITPTQLFIFAALAEKDGQKFKDLAGRVNIEGPTLTGVLDRMERVGLVERREDPDDRRSLLIFFSDKGREMLPRVLLTAESIDDRILKLIPDEEFRIFLKVIDQIGENSWKL